MANDARRPKGVEGTGASVDGFNVFELGNFPSEWRMATLGSLAAKVMGGGTPSTKEAAYWDGDIPWTTSAVIGEGDIFVAKHQRCITRKGLEESATQLVPKGSVLIGTRVGVGKAAVTTYDIAISQDLTALVPRPEVSAEFLALALKCRQLAAWFEENKRGTTIKGVSRNDVIRLMIPLPPLAEQRAIAEVLRTVQRAKEATDKIIAATRRLKVSLMQHLFTYGPVPFNQADQVPLQETEVGELPAYWAFGRVGELVEVRGGKRLPKGWSFAESTTPFPYIRVVDFRNGTVDRRDVRFLREEDHRVIARYVIRSEDVYISIAGTIGLVGSVPPELEGANLTENAARLVITARDRALRDYLVAYLASGRGQREIEVRTTKTSQPKLALARIRDIPIPLPPVEEQRRIAAQLMGVDEKLAAEEKRREALDALFKSLLHHLMTGKLRLPEFARGRS
jgi:type I restriction enzyme S subunit